MEREKMIEEMIRDYYPEEVANSESIRYAIQHGGYANIVRLFDLGYRKIPDGAVVMTREEYKGLYEDAMRGSFAKQEYIEKAIKDTRKETAREILQILQQKGNFTYDYPDEPHSPIITYSDYILEEIAKKYGVEVK